ncbi:MAG TPA: UDP-N-acetylmuramate--L-alanine ligase [Pusillimonas sp.]|uniref:UDP-N-acetylmuramate--L-alanine ligase n=1 Tax=unclassified Pusillimonas TaxID=2640016 RepID=UPI0026154CC9|nr:MULTISPECIES: UDP-N-acetylmuramate--L-alanine ligase [unclassified Pusillimonas]HLU20005.1 UDP-N-acetylmuramate--L-alanine ligase [Pusillimonas sp.]
MKHRIQSIHFVGIGGSGMSGIAEVLLNLGYAISGSDMQESSVTRRLEQLGAKVSIGHDAANVQGVGAIVTSTAVSADNPEVLAARAARIPVVPRALMLAELMRLKRGIAVAGTHGKTTTTSLVASVLAGGGLDPTFVIGGRLTSAGANARLGQGEYIVVEADESDASFLNLLPVMAIITNIDVDHMDTYGHDVARLKSAFIEFTQRLPFYGSAVVCSDDANVREIIPLISRPVTTYGFNDEALVRAVNVRPDGTAMAFDVERRSVSGPLPTLSVRLSLPGKHNVLNALAAIAVATELGVSDQAIAEALETFHGVGRRFTLVGDFPVSEARGGGSFTLVDDYGHHPVEMAATLEAARGAWPDRRIVLAFQPHRYTRTRDCFEDFVHVLSQADAVLLTDVYPAGEAPLVAADGRALARAIRVAGKVEPVFIEDVADLAETIMNFVVDGDVVVVMGAGSISRVPARIGELV